MSFAKSGYRGGTIPANDDNGLKCAAMGCKCIASVRLESGPWLCTAHAFIPRDIWQITTDRLHDNSWLVDFIAEMHTMHNQCQDWRGFALQFWENEPECGPDPRENHTPYVNRMRGELLYRCQLIAKRPPVRLPQQVAPAGRFTQRKPLRAEAA